MSITPWQLLDIIHIAAGLVFLIFFPIVWWAFWLPKLAAKQRELEEEWRALRKEMGWD